MDIYEELKFLRLANKELYNENRELKEAATINVRVFDVNVIKRDKHTNVYANIAINTIKYKVCMFKMNYIREFILSTIKNESGDDVLEYIKLKYTDDQLSGIMHSIQSSTCKI